MQTTRAATDDLVTAAAAPARSAARRPTVTTRVGGLAVVAGLAVGDDPVGLRPTGAGELIGDLAGQSGLLRAAEARPVRDVVHDPGGAAAHAAGRQRSPPLARRVVLEHA